MNRSAPLVGPVDGAADASGGVGDGGGRVRVRALRVPIAQSAVEEVNRRQPQLQRRYDERSELDDLGRDLAQELAAGGRTPLWDALSDLILEEREGSSTAPPTRSWWRAASPRSGARRRISSPVSTAASREPGFLPVGVQLAAPRRAPSRLLRATASRRWTASTRGPGRLALVLLLAGPVRGHYRVEETAADGVLPLYLWSRPLDDGAARRPRRGEGRGGDDRQRGAPAARRVPDAEIFVADDGSRDGTATAAAAAGASVVQLSRLGKGQGTDASERDLPAGPLLVCATRTSKVISVRWSSPTQTSRWRFLPTVKAAASGSRSERHGR